MMNSDYQEKIGQGINETSLIEILLRETYNKDK